jgi:hypothetical protein
MASVEGTSFPYWGERFGWKTSGARIDRVGDRTVQTVFYNDASGRQIGYAIVSGRPPTSIRAGEVHWIRGTPYHVSRRGDATAVAWLRNGHLCVVAGRGVDARTLLALASWQQPTAA